MKDRKYWALLVGVLMGLIIGRLTIPDTVWGAELQPELKSINVTAYYSENPTGCRGDRMREGIAAGRQEWYGKAIVLYKDEDGKPGELIGVFEILDTGYGKDTGKGESRIKKGRHLGTIETGQTIDIYRLNYERCKEIMVLTNGKAFYQLIDAKG